MAARDVADPTGIYVKRSAFWRVHTKIELTFGSLE